MDDVCRAEFRRLAYEDAACMSELEAACFTLPWSRRQCCNALMQSSFAAFGMWANCRLLAYVSCYHVMPEMEIVNLAVRENERRKGIGRRLLRLVLQAGVKMGMQRAVLEVRETNLPAISLYQGLGFTQCGLRRHYYPDTREDALIFEYIPAT